MKLTRFSLSLLLTLWCWNAHAAWFEASGQAVIHNGNVELARQQATQEAIRQALLFAGASIRSVQSMADGLLQDERMEIRATGEVNSVELIDEVFEDDYVTIRIRADIFPNENQCSASDYKKTIVTSWFHMDNRHQAKVGSLFNIGRPLAQRIREEFSVYARNAEIIQVLPYIFYPEAQNIQREAMSLAEQTGAQFVLMGTISEISFEEAKPSLWQKAKFWDKPDAIRHIGLNILLIDGSTGEIIYDRNYRGDASWSFHEHKAVDTSSQKLWDSNFGATVNNIVQKLATDIDETISCMPSYGRIVQVGNNRISASIGSTLGVKQGDELSVFQVRQFFSPNGSPHMQYQIHPSTFIVEQVFHGSSILRTEDGSPMANIQPNDFVVRR